MTSTDTLRAEADAIGRRHPHVLGGCPPHAAVLHRLAAFITENDLPDASLAVSHNGRLITVGATHCDLPENVVCRWAQAIDSVVTETPADFEGGAATLLQASGTVDGTHYLVSAFIPVPVTA